MFYSLISKIPYLSESVKDYRMLKIFIVGSVLYLTLHYFLYSGYLANTNYKWAIYPVMIIDFLIAYWLMSSSGSREYTEREKESIAQDLEKLRQLQRENDGSEVEEMSVSKKVSEVSEKVEKPKTCKISKKELGRGTSRAKEVKPEPQPETKEAEPEPTIPVESVTSEVEKETVLPVYTGKVAK